MIGRALRRSHGGAVAGSVVRRQELAGVVHCNNNPSSKALALPAPTLCRGKIGRRDGLVAGPALVAGCQSPSIAALGTHKDTTPGHTNSGQKT